MSTTESFIFFHALPPELRHRIWEMALSVRSVWAAVRSHHAESYLTASRLPLMMVYIGPAPYLAGLSSREARRLLEQFYIKPIRVSFSGLATKAGSYWVDLDTTVVYLGGDSFDVTPVLDSFGTDALSKFKHVALPWCQFRSMDLICQRLATRCPALRTIIIRSSVVAFPKRLSLETAGYYATIPEYAGPELGYEKPGAVHLRSLLLKYFGDSPPRIHLLAPDSTELSS